MSNKIGLLKSFKYSILDFKNLFNLKIRGTGATFLYILFLGLFVVGFKSFELSIYINNGIDNFIKTELSKIPEFSLKDGNLKIDGEMPIRIDVSENPNNRSILIIDTTGATFESELENYSSGILITKDYMIVKENPYKPITTLKLKDIPFSIQKSDLANYLGYIKYFVIIYAFFGFIFFIIKFIFMTLIIALICKLALNDEKYGFKYGTLFKISIYASTLPLLIKTILTSNTISSIFSSFLLTNGIYFGVAIFIVITSGKKHLNDLKNGEIVIEEQTKTAV